MLKYHTVLPLIMDITLALKNHVMLEEAYEKAYTPQKYFEKRVGKIPGNPGGIETPLGHTFSLGLELIYDEGTELTPDVDEFIEYVNKDQPWYSKISNLMVPTFECGIIQSAVKYFAEKGLSKKGQNELVYEVLGPDGYY